MRFYTIIFIFCIPFPSFGQVADNTNSDNESNIYNQSLIQYLIFLKDSNKLIPDTLWIEDAQNITDKLISKHDQTKFIKLKEKDFENIFKYKDTLSLYKIYPLEFEDNRFSIMLVPFRVRGNEMKSGYVSGYSGSYIIYFNFKDNKFIFSNVAYFGM